MSQGITKKKIPIPWTLALSWGGDAGYSTGINQSSHNHFTQPALRALATLNSVEGERARDYHIAFLFATKA
jgi:hypothetical protein